MAFRAPVGALPVVDAEVRELRRRAERIAGGLDVVVWSPRLSPGGGLRLFLSLLPRLLRQERIRSVRWAVPAGALGATTLAAARAEGLAIIELSGQHGRRRARAEILRSEGRVFEVRGNDAWRTATASELCAGCDVFYSPWPHGDPPPELDVPIVCTYQDTTLIDYPEAIGAAAALREREIGEAWLRASATTVVTSRSTAMNLARLYGDLATGLVVIRQAVRPDPLGICDPVDDAPPPGMPERYILFAGNTAVHKNLDLVLTAWSRLEDRELWPLVVCGHGSEALLDLSPGAGWRAAQLYGLVMRLEIGPASGLHVLGFVSEGTVGPLIAGAAALVMASFTEGGGSFPAEEALQAGVPVLCSDIPVMREHLDERSATIGWFDPASVDSIGRALRELAANYPVRKSSAMAGRDDHRPTWDDVAARYAAVLADAASWKIASQPAAT